MRQLHIAADYFSYGNKFKISTVFFIGGEQSSTSLVAIHQHLLSLQWSTVDPA